jgi:hypothetical protein
MGYPGTVEIQQAIRFNLFHILQASARADDAGVPAKGLTDEKLRHNDQGSYKWCRLTLALISQDAAEERHHGCIGELKQRRRAGGDRPKKRSAHRTERS